MGISGNGLYAYFLSLLLQGIISLHQKVEPCHFVASREGAARRPGVHFSCWPTTPQMSDELTRRCSEDFLGVGGGTGACRNQVFCVLSIRRTLVILLQVRCSGIFFCISFIIKEEIRYNYKNLERWSFILAQAKLLFFSRQNGMGKNEPAGCVYFLSFCKAAGNPIDSQNICHDADFFVIQGFYEAADGTP